MPQRLVDTASLKAAVAAAVSVQVAAAGVYMKELIKYPPQFKVGFLSNNPPVYDILPKVKEAIDKRRLGKQPAAGR